MGADRPLIFFAYVVSSSHTSFIRGLISVSIVYVTANFLPYFLQTDATKSRKAVELERHIRSYKFVAMPTAEECQNQIDKPNIAFASTWISLSTKGIVNEDYIDFNMALDDIDDMHPLCDARQARKSIFFDDVDGIKRADQLKYSAEIGLKDLLLDIGPYEKIKTIEEVGTRIAIALQNNVSSWVLASLATLYWRVKGNSSEAVKCALVSYSFAPERAKDIALLSMVDILHRSNRIDEAVVVLDKALDTDTPLVATHFVAANLLASQVCFYNHVFKRLSFFTQNLLLLNFSIIFTLSRKITKPQGYSYFRRFLFKKDLHQPKSAY